VTHDSIIRRVELFSGFVSPAEARVYARFTLAAGHQHELKQLKLSGHLIGPECEFAQTLPARVPFIDRGSGETVLAEAVVPDPCFWTPELPFLYRAKLQLHSRESVIEQYDSVLGIRRLGVRGRELYFEGKRFVLRGVRFDKADVLPPSLGFGLHFEDTANYLRDTWTAIVTSSPTEQLCQFASRRGILLVADVAGSEAEHCEDVIVEELRRLAQWPAVGIVVLAPGVKLPDSIRSCVPNLLLSQWVWDKQPLEFAPWAQLIFAEVNHPTEFAGRTAGCSIPVVAVRRLSERVEIEQGRLECDALQRDLASYGDFAGYVV